MKFRKISQQDLHFMPSSNMHPADTYFHFSFANYYNPQRMGFGSLRVLNDDDVIAHGGFGQHPHRDMEIVSYIVDGHLTHWDSVTDEENTIGRGSVQAISAGSGVWHSELNTQDESCRFLQIWLIPQSADPQVRYNSHEYNAESRNNRLSHIVGNSSNRDTAPLWVNSDVNLYVTELTDSTAEVTMALVEGRQLYLNCITGDVSVSGQSDLKAREALEISGPAEIRLSSKKGDAHVILIEMAVNPDDWSDPIN